MSFNLLTSFSRRTVSSFFNRRSAEQLWKSVFSVSAAGRKKGRGRGARARDLNRGQRIGDGLVRAVLPGFDAPPIRAGAYTVTTDRVKYMAPDPDRQAKILARQQDVRRKKKERMHPLLRGYSGTKVDGRKLGWPMVDAASPTEDQTTPMAEEVREQLKQFQTVCLWMKRRRIMTPQGRSPEIVALMAVGNGEGLVGFATAAKNEPRPAINEATSKAIKQLRFVERLEDRTVYQDFFAECQGVRVFVQRAPEGHGLVCHRVLKLYCQLAGIKDIKAKVQGNTRNYVNIIKAFSTGLVNQETHQQLADRARLLVVETRRENNYVPRIIAAPEKALCRVEEELKPDEVFDVDELYGQGRYPLKKQRIAPFYEYLESWKRKLWMEHPWRNFDSVKIRLMADRLLPNFEPHTMERHNLELHRKALTGEKPIPVGLGWNEIKMRDDWSPFEKKKK